MTKTEDKAKLDWIEKRTKEAIENLMVEFESAVDDWELGEIDGTTMKAETEKANELVWTLQFIGLITTTEAQELSDQIYDQGLWD